MDTVKPGIMKPVKSSNITAMGHDPETGEFFVAWRITRKGKPGEAAEWFESEKISAYAGVPADVAEAVMGAGSPGAVVRTLLIPNYQHRYLPPGNHPLLPPSAE